MKYKRMEYSVCLFIKQYTNRNIFKQKPLEKNFLPSFYEKDSTCSRFQSHYEEIVCF